MLFQELPTLAASKVDNSEILVGSEGKLYRTGNLYAELLDAEMVRLVLNKVTPNSLLNNHLTDLTLHRPIADNTVSSNSTWSSNRVTTAIAGSNPWFNLDSVPEGTTNKYWTDDRAKAIVASTTQGIPVIDHKAIATQLVSVLMGFNDTLFRYDVVNKVGSIGPISVSVNGGPATVDYFEVKPGVNEIIISTNGANYSWVCKELAHQITQLTSGVKVITPRLSLDSFVEGTTNKFWNTTTFGSSLLANQINNHINGTGFVQQHTSIADNGINTSTTWSSSKIVNYVASEIAKNRAALNANTKAVAILQEVGSSGANVSGYSWDSVQNGSIWTHYVRRALNTTAFTNSGSLILGNGNIAIPPGTWMVYWDADMTMRSGLFANVTNAYSYIALSTTPRIAALTVPGIITNTTTSSVSYQLLSRFNSTTAFTSSVTNTWLQPQSLPGVNELYAVLHLERIR